MFLLVGGWLLLLLLQLLYCYCYWFFSSCSYFVFLIVVVCLYGLAFCFLSLIAALVAGCHLCSCSIHYLVLISIYVSSFGYTVLFFVMWCFFG